MRFLRYLPLFVALLAAPAAAQIQVQQTPTRLDSSSVLCSIASAVNATQAAGTCTITPPTGQKVYITALHVANCLDGTASQSGIQLNFTTTNLGGLVLETSILTAATITTNAGAPQCDRISLNFTTPVASATPGTAVTVVPPAQQAHSSYPITVWGYFAP